MNTDDLAIDEQLFRRLRNLIGRRLMAIAAGDFARARAVGRERRLYLALLKHAQPVPACRVLSAA